MVNVNQLSNEIAEKLKQYTNEVTEEIEAAQMDVAKNLKNTLKINSPEKLGDYKKGWRIKKVKKAVIVHNATSYQLTHLLEHGHVKRNGSERTQEKPHIRPAEEVAIKDYLDRIEEAIKG